MVGIPRIHHFAITFQCLHTPANAVVGPSACRLMLRLQVHSPGCLCRNGLLLHCLRVDPLLVSRAIVPDTRLQLKGCLMVCDQWRPRPSPGVLYRRLREPEQAP